MRSYSCDICGGPMPPEYERGGGKRTGIAASCQVDDCCPRCARIGKTVPVRDILLSAWKKLSAEGDSEAELRERSVKAETMERLRAYRKAHKLGCLRKVAELAGGGVTDDLLRDVLAGEASLELGDWQRIAAALDKLEAA